jgi:hypothetical protein
MSKQRVRKLDEAGLRKLVQGMLEEAFGRRSSEYYGGPMRGQSRMGGREWDEAPDRPMRAAPAQPSKHMQVRMEALRMMGDPSGDPESLRDPLNAWIATLSPADKQGSVQDLAGRFVAHMEGGPTNESRVRKLDEAGLRRLVRSMLRQG